LFNDATAEDMKEAQNEFEHVLHETTVKLHALTKEQNTIVDGMKLCENGLHQLDVDQARIRESLEPSCRQVIVINPQTHVAEVMINAETLRSNGICSSHSSSVQPTNLVKNTDATISKN